MGRRDPSSSGKRSGESAAPAPRCAVAASAASRAQLLVEATRAILRSPEASELSGTLCQLLIHPGLYSEACIALVYDEEPARRSYYAGSDKACAKDPDRFWTAPARKAALDKLLKGESTLGQESLPGALVLALRRHGRTLGVLALSPTGAREVNADELGELQSLADDLSLAVAKLRDEAPQRALATSERRLRETFEQAGLGITRIDMNGRFLEVNQKFCEMLGYTREELLGLNARDVTVPEDYGAGPAFRAQAQLGRAKVLIGEKRYVRKDGSHIWVRRTMSPALDEDGRMRDGISVVEDITERKTAEEAMRRERLLLRTIVDALPDFIHVKDAGGRFQMGNQAWLKARWLQPDEVQGKTVHDIFPSEIARRMEDQDRSIIASGEPVIDQESPLYVLDESGNRLEHWSLTSKVPMRDEAGNVVGIVGISRDITSRRRMERERAMEHGIARVLSESRSIEDTMPRLIRAVCQAMGWDYGARWAWDAGSNSLRRAEWWCAFEPELEASDAQYWSEIVTPHVGGLLGKAWLERSATWVRDIETMENFRRKPSCVKFGFRSGYAFPILAHDEALGVMEFFGRDLREPDEELLEVSGAISNQIGQFIRRKQAEESLQESEQQLRAMFDNADVGIVLTALDTRYLRVNDKFCGIVGYAREELLRMRSTDVNVESNVEVMRAQRSRMMTGGVDSVTMEKQLVRKDGSLIWVSLANSLVRASDGTPRYFIAVIQDISENKRASEALKESEEQFRKLAHYDIITALPNRALFYDRLGHAIAQAKRDRCALAVLFVDVDRFKHVNDTFGHAAGDQLLKLVSDRLSGCVRANDTVGRLGGDEFAIVLSRLTVPDDAGTVAQKIVDELNLPFHLEGAELFVTSSIGITVCPADSSDADELIRNADIAMYQAKERGRNNYQFYTPEMTRRTREMLNMEGELRRALEREELVLHYQPKVSLATRQVSGFEALLRWRHPERGLIPPGDFIPLLEETGLIVQAGEWVLRAVCRQLKEWQRSGTPMVPVAVNLSARQFLSPNLAANIRAALEESGSDPGLLEVEITESSIMQDTSEAIRALEYLAALGVMSAIDDFGTGYSSLAYLKRFPLRALKIDRSFVRDITTDPDDATITEAIISMAHSLKLYVIAEGVETVEQLAFLMRYGCDEVQGFLFSRPVPGEECAAFITDPARIAAVIDSVALTAFSHQ